MTNKKIDSEVNVDWKDFFLSIEEYIDFALLCHPLLHPEK
jgi:hypothetical protein